MTDRRYVLALAALGGLAASGAGAQSPRAQGLATQAVATVRDLKLLSGESAPLALVAGFGPKAFDSTVMLAVSAAFLLPFMTAFSTYRHIVPLYYFQMSYLAALVLRPSPLEETRWGARLLGWARG